MRTRLKRLFLVVVAIVMTIPSSAFKLNDVFYVKGADNNLLYQITSVKEGQLEVSVNAPRDAAGGNVTPNNPVIEVPAEVTDSVNNTFKVTSIGRFGGTNITSVTIAEGVTTLGEGCFSRCPELTEVKLPSTISKINVNPFGVCPKLDKVEFTSANSNFVLDDGVLYTADYATLYYYPMNKTAEEYTVNSATKTVLAGAFASQPNLKKLILPQGLTSFDPSATTMSGNLVAYAMEGDKGDKYYVVDGLLCTEENGQNILVSFPYGKAQGKDQAVHNYTMPKGITVIGSRAFDSNTGLYSIKFTDVVTIDKEAFFRCNALTEVTIPASTTSVNSSAFADCSALRNIYVDEGNANYYSEGGVLFTNQTIEGEENPRKVLYIFPVRHMVPLEPADDDEKFGRNKTYEVPEGTQAIAATAFQSCCVATVKLPSSVEEIGKNAFRSENLKNIELNEGLKSIGESAFSGAGLESVTIPSTVTSLGQYCFYQMSNLKEIKIAANSQLTSIPNLTFSNNRKLTTFTFEGTSGNVASIATRAFENCSKLASFTMPASVSSIGEGAFSGCSSLVTITFAEGAIIETIGKNSFQQCTGLKEITIPNSVKKIEYEAFNSCQNLKTIHIPANTTSIDQGAFSLCGSLTKFDVDENNQQYSSVDGMLTSKDKKTLCIFPGGKANDEITLLSPSFTAIGERAFYYCKKLTNVTIPKHVTSIGKEAFRMCDNLKTIAFLSDKPIEENSIGTDAFKPQTGNKTILENCENFFVRKDNIKEYKDDGYWGQWSEKMKSSFEKGTEEYFPMSDKAVSLLKTTSTNYTLVVPATVTNEDDGKTYNVSMLGDYAFEGAQDNIKEVVLLGNINYIGACAFDKTKRNGTQTTDEASTPKQIENIFFTGRNQAGTELSTVRFGLNDEGVQALPEFLDGQNIYVRQSVYNKVKEDVNNSTWGQYASKLEYKIPLSFSTTYSTLSREFDVDMSEDNWSTKQNSPKVIAFTSGYYHKTVDAETKANKFYVHMESINCGASEGDGTYIPAKTGVLLKNADGSDLKDFYYQIYDQEEAIPAAPTDNLMQAVVERKGMLNSPNKDATYKYYDFGLGADDLLHRYMGTNGKEMDVHTSYLTLSKDAYDAVNPADPSAVKLCMVFDLDGSTTGIEDVKTDGQKNIDNEAYYTLQGVKVVHPTKGIYVHGGKKVVIK